MKKIIVMIIALLPMAIKSMNEQVVFSASKRVDYKNRPDVDFDKNVQIDSMYEQAVDGLLDELNFERKLNKHRDKVDMLNLKVDLVKTPESKESHRRGMLTTKIKASEDSEVNKRFIRDVFASELQNDLNLKNLEINFED